MEALLLYDLVSSQQRKNTNKCGALPMFLGSIPR